MISCGRLSWLVILFWVHIDIVHHIISCTADIMMCCWLWDTNMSCLLQAFVINRKVVYQNILCKWICNIYKFINFTSGVIYYSAPVGERSIAISLSVCLRVCLQACLWNRFTNLPRNFVCRSPVAVAQSSSGGIVIRYVLPVLWMTSRLAVVGCMALAALRCRGGVWCLWMPCLQIAILHLSRLSYLF